MKVFARSNGDQQGAGRMGPPAEDPKIRATKNTKTFRKSLETKNSEGTSKVQGENLEIHSEPLPIPGNETIIEGKVNESLIKKKFAFDHTVKPELTTTAEKKTICLQGQPF